MDRITRNILTVVFIFCLTLPAYAVNGKFYSDGHGGKVYFPLGDISFADEVVSFKMGTPSAAKKDSDPKLGTGIPDYDSASDSNAVTLGCGGTLVFRFLDNALIDIEGPDLYVFEIGPAVEPTTLSISKDGKNWIDIGKISGGKADVEISGYIKPGDVFYYVKLTDLKSDCGGGYPGADIDAVGAIGSSIKISIDSSVLFDFGKDTLKPEAIKELHRVAMELKKYPGATVIVEGHTDNRGTQAANQKVSEKRATAVRNYWVIKENLSELKFSAVGYGMHRPVALNDTEEGRAKNRRVEVIVLPPGVTKKTGKTDKGGTIAGKWKTNWGEMELRLSGEKVIGFYSEDNGEVFGTFKNGMFDGYWVEDEASTRCDKALRGRHYWGRVKMTFDKDLKSFKSIWGYCGETPYKADWTGDRK